MMTQQKQNQSVVRRHNIVRGVEPRNAHEVDRGLQRDPRKVVKKNTTTRAKRDRQNGKF